MYFNFYILAQEDDTYKSVTKIQQKKNSIGLPLQIDVPGTIEKPATKQDVQTTHFSKKNQFFLDHSKSSKTEPQIS